MNKRAKAYSRAFKQKYTVTQQQYKRITGENSPKEYAAFTKGYEVGILSAMNFVKNWTGGSNSKFGKTLRDKFEELKK